MIENTQIKLEDVNEQYNAFVEKFKPKKTTDDCYSPDNVYRAILDWVVKEYGIDPDNVVRPFWPGGDYERHEYPTGCTVVDNPPFSIISKICRRYMDCGIRFFLFAPYLTNFSSQIKGLTHVICDADITYENGAVINTAFLTNLEPGCEVRSAPELSKIIKEADNINRRQMRRELPKYSYPDNVLTSTMVGYMSKYGVEFRVSTDDCHFIRQLESQRQAGKTIFGSGYLLSEKAAAEKAAAEKAAAEKAAAKKAAAEKAAAHRWPLSDNELAIIRSLDKRGANG